MGFIDRDPRPLQLRYHVFAAFLVGWVSDPTAETSEKDGAGDEELRPCLLSTMWAQDDLERELYKAG